MKLVQVMRRADGTWRLICPCPFPDDAIKEGPRPATRTVTLEAAREDLGLSTLDPQAAWYQAWTGGPDDLWEDVRRETAKLFEGYNDKPDY